MAHIAGLVAAGLHPSPFPYADLVTTTTHKTLRGPRGGFWSSAARTRQAGRQVRLPGHAGRAADARDRRQGGRASAKPTAANSGRLSAQVVANAVLLAQTLATHGCRLVSGGTDNHLMLVDVTPLGVTGSEAEAILDGIGITVNKNAIPFDANPPNIASGIRVGTPATTTRGFGSAEMRDLAG